ncbi:hypothetical protein SOCEGT47_048280 [Sorangium cellulosum]|uniref:Secreted protein n=1 Tax=Sorangium cellulosum TaxID=56 RepID=A0A4P2Q516_SORCE|nr:hypothetical protein [Sorangium cellulosum]AUX24291.1 hypothetical protein SOCEGT47_048280 [Sorangium cellulosum]
MRPSMLARALGLLTALSAAACARAPVPVPGGRDAPRAPAARAPAAAGATPASGEAGEAPAGARYFHGAAEGAFRVTYGGSGAAVAERVVAGGARLELAAGGRVVAAAWEAELWAAGEPLVGSLAIAPRLGGGFLHWSRGRAFRSRDFTGPLAEVALGGGARAVRGARNGLEGVVIFTDQGPRVLLAGEDRGRALGTPAIHDLAALDAARAVRLDVFGRAATTADGGRTWVDVGRRIGLAPRGIGVAPDALSLVTALGRVAILPDGGLGRPDGDLGAMGSPSGSFALRFAGAPPGREAWATAEITPLAAAVSAGALLPDGTALGVLRRGVVARVDARTGATRGPVADWLPDGLSCAPMRADDGLLFLCAWDDAERHGGYVLRSERGEAPRRERAFSGDGFFVADDGGALGFVGGCAAEERVVSDEERDRRFGEAVVHPTICVRRGPGVWVERAVPVGEGEELVAWAPRRDGSAVALLRGERGALPAPVGAPRGRDAGGVGIVRLGRALPGWYWTPPSRDGAGVLVDRRFRARDDGGVDGWVSSVEWSDPVGQASLGVTVARDGSVTPHALPPDPAGMVVTGDHGLLVTRRAELYETLDHGRTWRAAGRSPVPPSAFHGACSALGCALTGVVRLGWGAGEPSPAVAVGPPAGCWPRAASRPDAAPGAAAAACPAGIDRPPAPPASPGSPADLPVLSCAPVGLPGPLPGGEPDAGPGAERWSVSTPHGEPIEIVADAAAPARGALRAGALAPPGAMRPGGGAMRPGGGAMRPGGGTRPAGDDATIAPIRTHSALFRPPFDLRGEVVRLDATDLTLRGFRAAQRAAAVPLLAAGGEVAWLVLTEAGELLLGPGGARALPLFEPRRGPGDGVLGGASGLLLGPGRALVLGERRRRMALEEHTPEPLRPARIIGLEREELRGRRMALALGDDGAEGVMVLDGVAPETAGVAQLDPGGGTPGEVVALAPWATLTAASDARCRAMKGAWRAVVALDPAGALRLDRRAMPAISPGERGIARVRWGRERVCLEALNVAVGDARWRGEAIERAALVARWTAPRGQGRGESAPAGEGVLRTRGMMQRLTCTLGVRADGSDARVR